MKKFMLIFIFMFLIALCKSQNFKLQVFEQGQFGNVDNIVQAKTGILAYAIGETTGGIFTRNSLTKYTRNISVNKVNESFNIVKSNELWEGKKKVISGMYQNFKLQNNNCIVYQEVLNDEQLGDIKLAKIDENALTIEKEITLFDFNKNNIVIDIKKLLREAGNTYKMQLSEGNKKILIVAEPEQKKDEEKTIFFTVTDENLKMVSERKLSFKGKWVNIKSYLCDDDGNVYISYTSGDDDGNVKKGDADDDPRKVMIVPPNNGVIKTVSIQTEGFTITHYGLLYSAAQNKVYIVGSYSKAWRANHLGVFYASVDTKTMTLSKVIKSDFSEDLVKKFDDDGFANSGKKNFGLSRYFLPAYKMRGDGSIDFILYYNEAERYDPQSSRQPDYYGGNFLDAHILNDKIIFSRIPRKMNSPMTNFYILFSMFSNDENLTFLYNDNAKNIEQNIDEKPKLGVVQKSEICATTISKEGIVKRQALPLDVEGKTIGAPHKMYPISKNEFFVVLEKLTFSNMSTAKGRFIKVTAEK